MNVEMKTLLKKAEDSIKGARILFDDELFSFAASRAYYAMFYLVSAILLTKEMNFSVALGTAIEEADRIAEEDKAVVREMKHGFCVIHVGGWRV